MKISVRTVVMLIGLSTSSLQTSFGQTADRVPLYINGESRSITRHEPTAQSAAPDSDSTELGPDREADVRTEFWTIWDGNQFYSFELSSSDIDMGTGRSTQVLRRGYFFDKEHAGQWFAYLRTEDASGKTPAVWNSPGLQFWDRGTAGDIACIGVLFDSSAWANLLYSSAGGYDLLSAASDSNSPELGKVEITKSIDVEGIRVPLSWTARDTMHRYLVRQNPPAASRSNPRDDDVFDEAVTLDRVVLVGSQPVAMNSNVRLTYPARGMRYESKTTIRQARVATKDDIDFVRSLVFPKDGVPATDTSLERSGIAYEVRDGRIQAVIPSLDSSVESRKTHLATLNNVDTIAAADVQTIGVRKWSSVIIWAACGVVGVVLLAGIWAARRAKAGAA